MLKRLGMLLTALFILVMALPALAQNAPAAPATKVVVNGQEVTYDFARGPHIHEGEVYIAAKALAAALGQAWNHDAASNVFSLGGKEVKWDYTAFRGPHIHDDNLFVAARPVAEAAGAQYSFDAASGIAAITVAGAPKVKVIVNGNVVAYNYARGPHVHEGRVYVAAAALAEALGVTWTYSPAGNGVRFDNKAVHWDYQAFRGPHNHDGAIFVAVRPVADTLGLQVTWVHETKSLLIER